MFDCTKFVQLFYFPAFYIRYPPNEFPVLSFAGAPASFPVQKENKILQKYLVWSDLLLKKAKAFIAKTLPSGPFIGIHLRNGIDWVSYHVSLVLVTKQTLKMSLMHSYIRCVHVSISRTVQTCLQLRNV